MSSDKDTDSNESSSIKMIEEAFAGWKNSKPREIKVLKAHASNRQIFRVFDNTTSYIGVLNQDLKENDSFVQFSKHFRSFNLPVPEIFHYSTNRQIYFETDLGDETLLDRLNSLRSEKDPFPEAILKNYKEVLSILPQFQIEAGRTFNYDWCYGEKEYGSKSMYIDMHSFRDNFLSRAALPFNQLDLEKDFDKLSKFLCEADMSSFMYRDFQARNIMLVSDKPVFIDYQGGRRGPLQYDVVSLLYQSSANIPPEKRNFLVEHYIRAASKHTDINPTDFSKHFLGFVVIRMLQVLGVYGKQGLGGGKEYFAGSIPSALKNLHDTLRAPALTIKLPFLLDVTEEAMIKFS